VNSLGERGLLGIAFDPNFSSNQFIYVYYTATTPAIHNRVSRFTANGDVVVAGSELVILNLNNLSSATNHNGGAIHFGPDGKLYIAVGENANSANAQTFANLLGKVLRINPDPLNLIPSDNPYFSDPTVTGVNKAIWALGLRNPFTFSFQLPSGRMFINDVGENTWEEINLGVGHSNYGWPICEGQSCGSTPPTDYRAPIYVYNHTTGTPTGCAIIGSAFYNPTTAQFPAEYIGKYYFADLCSGFIRYVDPNTSPPILSSTGFATGISSPVDLQVAVDGSLYYLARGSNSVFRIQYSGPSSIVINDISVAEGDSGTTTANFTVTLSPATNQTVTVQFATANGTANAPGDFLNTSGIVTFNPGQTSQPISVAIVGDTTVEADETFFVNLSLPVNATTADAQGQATILNDDVCGYSFSPASQLYPLAGGQGTINILAAPLCDWSAIPSDSWIVITSTANGTGNGSVNFEVRENFSGSARQGTMTIAGHNFLVVEDAGLGNSCGYALNPMQQSFTNSGGSGNINVTADSRCAWQAVSSVQWIAITSSTVGIGNGTVNYSVTPNSTGQGRSGKIMLAGQIFNVKQKG
ncbi:MAG TPA: PQQ-dependent sugar dehydrogenase, partial [Pyrinomonadaceae bacterium]